MTLAAVRGALATRLDTIAGLRVYDTPPDSIQELPAAIVIFGSDTATYAMTIGAEDVSFVFEVLLLLGSADEIQAQQDLEPYMDATGASSVKAAVEGTLGGNADWASVAHQGGLNRIKYPEKGNDNFWGAKFRVAAYKSG